MPPSDAQPYPGEAHLEVARRVLTRTPLIDGHNDLACVIRQFADAPGDVRAYDLRRRTPGCTDLERLATGMVGGQFWSVYIPCESGGRGIVRQQLEQIALAKEIFETYPDRFAEAVTADDVVRVFESGRIACLLGIEGGQVIESSLGALQAYARLGVRYMTLTHNCTTDWADSAMDEPRHGGLSPFGVEVVHEMNRMGMLVDLSHTSPDTMHDALDASQAPVIWSHSGARALVDHPRNVPDGALARVPENGGVVMVTFVPAFVSAWHRGWDIEETDLRLELQTRHGSDHARTAEALRSWRAENPMPPATLPDVADHIDHIRELAGVDHVGIGSDFDGSSRAVEGLEDVSTFPALFAELSRRGWSEEDLSKLAGGNILRVLRDAEDAAMRLQRVRGPGGLGQE